MRSVLRRAWKPLVPAVLLLLTIVPGPPAKAAPLGPCGYATVTLNGIPRSVPLGTSCTRDSCVGLSAGPYGAGLGSNRVDAYACVRI
jgi:hypothetical protein